MVDADAANIAKTYANAYPIFAYLHILPIFSQNPCGSPGAIHLAKSTAPFHAFNESILVREIIKKHLAKM